MQTLALVSLYGPRDENLFESSFETVWACQYLGNESLCVVSVAVIESVVAMVPINPSAPADIFFVVEKPGLEMRFFGGMEEEMDQE